MENLNLNLTARSIHFAKVCRLATTELILSRIIENVSKLNETNLFSRQVWQLTTNNESSAAAEDDDDGEEEEEEASNRLTHNRKITTTKMPHDGGREVLNWFPDSDFEAKNYFMFAESRNAFNKCLFVVWYWPVHLSH